MNSKNIIFDFGGVLLNIDYMLTAKAFQQLGVEHFTDIYSKKVQQDLFDRFEKGEISEAEFYEAIRNLTRIPLTDSQIKNAWNAMLISLPEDSTRLLEQLRGKHRLFLLSNSNIIHEKEFSQMIDKGYGWKKFYGLFEKVYFSHRIGMRKPDNEIFQKVITENNLRKEETVFLDDSPQHIEGARNAGLVALHVEQEKKIQDYFL
jgi:HAD superfamily hydrolase (TIGR01509 family)